MKQPRVIAIDLAKSVFQVCLFDNAMQVLSNRAMSRAKLQALLARQGPAHVVMEACGTAHFWARMAQAHGHRVTLLPPKLVTPYRQGQKTDGNDVLAIGIASQQPQIKTAAVKTLEQQALQSLKRIQEHFSDQLTASGNALRALASEFGLVIAKGTASLKRRIPCRWQLGTDWPCCGAIGSNWSINVLMPSVSYSITPRPLSPVGDCRQSKGSATRMRWPCICVWVTASTSRMDARPQPVSA